MRSILATAAVLVASGLTGAMATAQEVTLHLGHIQQAAHPTQAAPERFAEIVAERTEDAIQIVVQPAEQLAGQRRGLGNWSPSGFRIILSQMPIGSAWDLERVKIGVPEIPIYVSTRVESLSIVGSTNVTSFHEAMEPVYDQFIADGGAGAEA